jgi:hypothetical protein
MNAIAKTHFMEEVEERANFSNKNLHKYNNEMIFCARRRGNEQI